MRPIPESNRVARICSPLRSRPAHRPSLWNWTKIPFRYTVREFACSSRLRRVADVYCCNVPLLSKYLFIVPSTRGATTPPLGLHQRPGGSDSPCHSHRRGSSRAHLHAVVEGGSLPETSPAPLARTSSVAPAGYVYPPPGRGVQRCNRERIRGRLPVPPFDMVERWRSDVRLPLGVSCLTEGAALPGMARVAARRQILARMGHRRYVRAALKGWGWKPQACEARLTANDRSPGMSTFPYVCVGTQRVSSSACQRETGFHPRIKVAR